MLLINSCFLILQSGLFHFVNTVGADALIVELLFLHEVAVDTNLVLQLWCVFIHHVDDSSAFLAEKVHMTFRISIVAHAVFVDGDHLCRSFFAQHA